MQLGNVGVHMRVLNGRTVPARDGAQLQMFRVHEIEQTHRLAVDVLAREHHHKQRELGNLLRVEEAVRTIRRVPRKHDAPEPFVELFDRNPPLAQLATRLGRPELHRCQVQLRHVYSLSSDEDALGSARACATSDFFFALHFLVSADAALLPSPPRMFADTGDLETRARGAVAGDFRVV